MFVCLRLIRPVPEFQLDIDDFIDLFVPKLYVFYNTAYLIRAIQNAQRLGCTQNRPVFVNNS